MAVYKPSSLKIHTVVANKGYKANISSCINVMDSSVLGLLVMSGPDDACKSGNTFNRLFRYLNVE